MENTVPGLAILIVDDDPIVRRLLALSLRSGGCITYEATDVTEALKVLVLAGWTAIIVDLDMPGADGEEFVLRARNRGYDGLILVLSSDAQAKGRCARLGVPLVQKPFNPDELLQRIVESVGAGVRRERPIGIPARKQAHVS